MEIDAHDMHDAVALAWKFAQDSDQFITGAWNGDDFDDLPPEVKSMVYGMFFVFLLKLNNPPPGAAKITLSVNKNDGEDQCPEESTK